MFFEAYFEFSICMCLLLSSIDTVCTDTWITLNNIYTFAELKDVVGGGCLPQEPGTYAALKMIGSNSIRVVAGLVSPQENY